MAHTYTNMLNHVIFSTKDRQPLLDQELIAFLKKHEVYYDERYAFE